jgi:hypothetical protein
MWLVAENMACLADEYGLLGNMACVIIDKYGLLGNMACVIDKYGLLKKKGTT